MRTAIGMRVHAVRDDGEWFGGDASHPYEAAGGVLVALGAGSESEAAADALAERTRRGGSSTVNVLPVPGSLVTSSSA